MTKIDLIEKLAEKKSEMAAGEKVAKREAGEWLEAYMETIVDAMKNGETIKLTGFGTFEVSERAARVGRNPQTGETMKIEASKAPKFKFSKAVKDKVNA